MPDIFSFCRFHTFNTTLFEIFQHIRKDFLLYTKICKVDVLLCSFFKKNGKSFQAGVGESNMHINSIKDSFMTRWHTNSICKDLVKWF